MDKNRLVKMMLKVVERIVEMDDKEIEQFNDKKMFKFRQFEHITEPIKYGGARLRTIDVTIEC